MILGQIAEAWRQARARLCPKHASSDQLDTLLADHLASTEALSQASAEAKASAEVDTQRARAVAEAARDRVQRLDGQRQHRQEALLTNKARILVDDMLRGMDPQQGGKEDNRPC